MLVGMLKFNAFVFVIFSIIAFHCDSVPVNTITQQQYTTVQIGWTRTQVTNLVGSSGRVVAQAGTGSANVIIVEYTGNGTGAINAVVAFGFIGGQLVSKSEVGFVAAVNNKITLQQYSTIQIGWTQQQVTQLLGGTGNIVSQAGTSDLPFYTTTVQYTSAQSSIATASFTFTGGSLSAKSQLGLDTGIYTITQQQYTTVQIGWTRAQVTNLVGSSGNAVSEAGTGSANVIIVEYTGNGTGATKAVVAFGFIGGQLVSKSEVGFVAAVNNKITLQQYSMIQIGWTQQQVTQFLGGTGNIVSQAGTSGSPFYTTIVQYTSAQSSIATASFTFTGGSLSAKSQLGLDTGIYTITPQQYTTIQIGWTRAQVTKWVGSSGNVVSEAGTGSANTITVEYSGTGATTAVVAFGFVDGKLVSEAEFGFK
ncbi:unnamed protein product [Didymodactylos carnosus]|uniref:Uncharacterized protein n=1 Tax=Didymodactylos carnosus TaxID=1234261 RepID=A0A815XGU8_9BILA|nr:unnamed protein product [Didymodactylos carnosus]CAF4418598.1 unnamed protein product [Didymodactylos carnosus]